MLGLEALVDAVQKRRGEPVKAQLAANGDVLIRLNEKNNGVTVEARVAADGNNNTNNDLATGLDKVSTGPISVSAVFDFDANTLDITYDIGSGPVTASTLGLRPDQGYDVLRTAVTTNSDDFGDGDFASVDSITVNYVVPEPASLALVGIGGALILTRRRKVA